MDTLDDLTLIKKNDRFNTLESIKKLPNQCKHAWRETQLIDFPQNYYRVNKIVIAGMGGSTYGSRIVKSLYDGASYTKIPVELVNNYWLPGYVDTDTLVILSSYSGNTEETINAGKIAKEKKAKIIGITTGGNLASFLKDGNYPAYIFDPIYNPCKQPRIGSGYMIMGLIGILSKLKKIPVGGEEIEKLVTFLQEQSTTIDMDAFTTVNPAKQLAVKLQNKIPIVIVADFLEGAAYAVRNMFHETAKQFGEYFSIPELNHHLLEGLTFPKTIKDMFLFVFITSKIYDERNSTRLRLTQEIVKKNGIKSEVVTLSGYSGLTQVMEFINFGSWVSFYLAMLNGIDPAKIPWVDYFKEKLT